MIDLTNYEEYLLRQMDGELNQEELGELNAFLKKHPSLEAEFKWLEATRLDPQEKIVFQDKASLYRHEPVKAWWGAARTRWAAVAAVILLAVCGLWISREHQGGLSSSVPPYARRTAPVPPAQPTPPLSPATAVSQVLAPRKSSPAEPSRPSVPPPPQPSRTTDMAVRHPSVKLVPDAPRPAVKENPAHSTGERKPGTGGLAPISLARAGLGTQTPPAVPDDVAATPVTTPTPDTAPADRYDPVDTGLPASTALASTTEKLENGKRELDQAITRGLTDFQQKKSTLLGNLEKKQIRIGRFTLALNQ